jgi:multisubunit Na+/H+ antiporter MnhG subunit
MKESGRLRNNEDRCTIEGMKPRGVWRWIDFYQKNKPQTNALSAGIMILIFGGQHIGWGIFNNHLKSQPWAGGYEDDGDIFWAIISFFIAGIVGFLIAGVAVNKFSKLSIYVS